MMARFWVGVLLGAAFGAALIATIYVATEFIIVPIILFSIGLASFLIWAIENWNKK